MPRRRAEVHKERPTFGARRLKLSIADKDPNFHYVWLNDDGLQIQEALEAGYEFVERDDVGNVGETDVTNQQDVREKRISRVVDKIEGKPLIAYLLKIKQEWYDEDERKRQQSADLVDAAIRRGVENVEHGYGEVKVSRR